ncbi:AAA family ATPase [uncultured Thiodictyon sp.]|uniref:AAA family ATPase n=1 Tax=uncultured Thiodictyon sp. TaxID=1846217 RepID=UPI0026006E8E|nr:AAA family ATPase [uncultured Thiodictyon sp.]
MDGFVSDGLSPEDLEELAGGSYHPGPDHDPKPDAKPAEATGKPRPIGVTLIRADRIKPERIDWVWPGWLARGKVHVMAGAPGTGKTTASVALAAIMTIGGRWPDGSRAPIGDVLVWSGEDDPKDTLVPRLIASGADLRRVHFIASHTDEKGHPRAFDPATDIDALSEHLATMDPAPALLIVDPIVSAIAGDSHKNAEVRRSLQPLVDLATLRGVAVLGISHFSKGTQGRDPTERVTGSLAFGALARVVLATAKLSDDEGGGRILVRAKSNLGIDSGGFGYDLEQVELEAHPGIITTRVQWGEALEGSARDLLSRADEAGDPEQQSATTEAMDWLLEHLKSGPAKAKDVQREAKDAGLTDKALRTAREKLGIKPTKGGFSAGWVWAIPTPEDAHLDPKVPKMPKNPEQEKLGTLGTFGDVGHLGSDPGAAADDDMVEV